MSAFTDALTRLRRYNLNPFNALTNAFGMTGTGGPDTNFEPCMADIATVGGEVATLSAEVFSVGGSGRWIWDTGTADVNPGPGKLRANHATPASATYLYASTTDADGVDVAALLTSWDDSTSTAAKGTVCIAVVGDRTQRNTYRITSAIVSATGYVKIPVASVSAASVLSSGAAVVLGFIERGDKGDAGPAYTLPAATAGTLGGVKVGSNLSVAVDGTLSATAGVTVQMGGATVATGITALNFTGGAQVSAAGSTATVYVPSAVTARYWRLLATGTSYDTGAGNYFMELAEINFYPTNDLSGTKLSVSSATASSTYSGGFPASQAFDANAATYWATSNGAGTAQWIYADLGSGVSSRVASLSISALCPGSGTQHMYLARTLALQYSSDASAWTTLATLNVPDATGTGGSNVTVSFSNIQ